MIFRSQDKEFLKSQYRRYVQPLVDANAPGDVIQSAWERVCQRALSFDLGTELHDCPFCNERSGVSYSRYDAGNIYSPPLMIIEDVALCDPAELDFLDKVLASVNIVRAFQYRTFAVKCNVKGISIDEAFDRCSYYLEREIQIVKPKVILCMGSAAAHLFCPDQENILGTWTQYKNTPVMFTHGIDSILAAEKKGSNALHQMKKELWLHMLRLVERFPQVQGIGYFVSGKTKNQNVIQSNA